MTPKQLAKLLREHPDCRVVLEGDVMDINGEAEEYHNKSLRQWYDDLLKEFKDDPLLEAEGRIFELEEHMAKGMKLGFTDEWKLEAEKLLKIE